MATEQLLKDKVIHSLRKVNTEDKKKFRHSLVEAILNCDNGKELSVIFKMYLMDDNQLLSFYTCFHNSLQEELTRIGPYNIEPYESVANGLSSEKNHIDLHIYCSNSKADPNIAYNLEQVLYNSKLFSKVELLKNYPIISCVHIDTGCVLNIDISEPYDLHNSELINKIKQTDNRINELMLFIMIWFKNLHIYSCKYMTKYCLMTLIIFYLQNTNPPVLPSIKTIQQTAQTNIINGIHFGLSSCIPINLTQNIHQMIKGFFEFYNFLDFENVIIAPYLGKVIKKEDFKNKVFNYPEYEAQMGVLAAASGKPSEELETHYPICVQDMFFLNRNIANRKISISLSEENFKYLKKCINMAYKKFSDPKVSIKNLYKSLLVNIIEELDQEFMADNRLTFDIIPKKEELKSLAKFADQPLNIRKLWTKAYIAAIPQIISAVYKMDVTLLPPTEHCEFKTIDETEELPLPFEWSICSSVDLWADRAFKKSDANFIENELERTKNLFAERRLVSQFAIHFKGFIKITITKNFDSLQVAASTKSDEKSYKIKKFSKFFGSFKTFMQNYNLRHRIQQLESEIQQTKI